MGRDPKLTMPLGVAFEWEILRVLSPVVMHLIISHALPCTSKLQSIMPVFRTSLVTGIRTGSSPNVLRSVPDVLTDCFSPWLFELLNPLGLNVRGSVYMYMARVIPGSSSVRVPVS